MIGYKKKRIERFYTLTELLVTHSTAIFTKYNTKSQPPLRIIGDLWEKKKERKREIF